MNSDPPETPPPSRRRWHQFSLRSLLVLTTLCAVAIGCYRWWFIVRELRRRQAWIRTSIDLTAEQKENICGWAIDQELLEALNMMPPPDATLNSEPHKLNILGRPLVAQMPYRNLQGQERLVFVFGGLFRENGGVVVLCDVHGRVLTWASVRLGSVDPKAWVSAGNGCIEVKIDAYTNGLHSSSENRGLYRFTLADAKITALPVVWESDEAGMTVYAMRNLKDRVFERFRAGGGLPRSVKDLPEIRGVMKSQVDGWGRTIEMRIHGTRITLTSYGCDGKPGGSGDDEDIVGEFDATVHNKGDEGAQEGWIRDPRNSWVRQFR